MNNRISLQQAIDMTTLFRLQKESVIKPEYLGKDILSNAETFGREAFDAVLAQPGCVGLRVYYGMKEDLRLRTIIVGVDQNDQDILSIEGNEEPIIVEDGNLCPPFCPPPPPSPLNP